MNYTTKIFTLRAMIGYDSDKDIRDSIELYDFKRSIEYAIRRLCSEAKLVLKAAFIPFVKDSQFFGVTLLNEGFEMVAPESYYVLSYDGSITEITEREVKDVVSNTYDMNLELYRIALRKLGSGNNFIQTNTLIDSQPETGIRNTIATLPSANTLTLTTDNGVIGSYLINFSKASESKYSYSKIADKTGTTLTMDASIKTDSNYLWKVTDETYMVTSLPYLMVMIFQGLPKENYFDTYTTIPMDSLYLDLIDDIALEYLYKILKGRFDKFYQVYMNQIQITNLTISRAKKLANRRASFTKIQPFTLFDLSDE